MCQNDLNNTTNWISNLSWYVKYAQLVLHKVKYDRRKNFADIFMKQRLLNKQPQ